MPWVPILLLVVVQQLHGQTTEPDSLVYPGFSLLRANEDYSFLKPYRQPSSEVWTKLKYIPLGQQSFVSIGGDWPSQLNRYLSLSFPPATARLEP